MGNSKMSFSDFKKENNSERRGSNSRNRNGKNIQNNNWNSPKFKVTEIMKEILEKGYRDKSKNVLRKELVSIEAKNIAENMKITNSQLRAFFNELKKLKQKYIDENEKNVDKLHIELLILKSKLEYKKGGKKITNEFSEFMEKNIDIVIKENTIQSYKDFLVFFETVLGYMYGLGGVNNR